MADAVPAAAQQTIVTAGVNIRFLSGSFGSDQTTTMWFAPAVLRVENDRVEAAAYFPYLVIDNGTVAPSQGGFLPMRGTVVNAPNVGMPMGSDAGSAGRGMMGGQSTTALVTSQSGLGDLVASLGYRVIHDTAAGVQLVLSGRIKVPTASAMQGLGTGKVDTGATATLRKQIGAGWFFAEGGYLFIGEPDDVELRNAALWGLGGGRRLTERVSLLFSTYGNTALLAGFAAPAEVSAGLGIRAGLTTFSVMPAVGLSQASPRYAVTVGIGGEIFRR